MLIGDRPYRSNARAALSSKSEIPGLGYPSRSNTRTGISPGTNTRAVLPFRMGDIRAGNPFKLNTKAGPPTSERIPGRCYHLEANYLGGAAPPNRTPGKGPLLQRKYQGGVIPFRSSPSAGPSHSDRIPGRRYLLEAKFRKMLTRPDQIPGTGSPPTCQIPERRYPLEAKYLDGISPSD